MAEEKAVTDMWIEIISPAKIQVGSIPMGHTLTPIYFDLHAGVRDSINDLRTNAGRDAHFATTDTTRIHITKMMQRKQAAAISQSRSPKQEQRNVAARSTKFDKIGWLLTVAVCAGALVFCVRYLKI